MTPQQQLELVTEYQRYQKKVADQKKEIEQLKAQVEVYEKGLKETGLMLDAILFEIAKKFGRKVKAGRRFTLDADAIGDNLKNCVVHTVRNDAKHQYVITAEEKQDE